MATCSRCGAASGEGARFCPARGLREYIKSLGSLPNRLKLAQELVRDSRELVDAFDETVRAYWDYANLHPFTPGRTVRYLPGCEKGETVTAALERGGIRHCWEVTGARSLDFVYLDREIVPAAGHAKSGVVKADAILAAVRGARPIIAEIKTATDTDAFGALLQGLHAAAQLAGPTQRARLRLWCSCSDFVLGNQIPDVYVLLVNHPTIGTKAAILAETLKLREELQRQPTISAHVRRLEVLKIACSQRRRPGHLKGMS